MTRGRFVLERVKDGRFTSVPVCIVDRHPCHAFQVVSFVMKSADECISVVGVASCPLFVIVIIVVRVIDHFRPVQDLFDFVGFESGGRLLNDGLPARFLVLNNLQHVVVVGFSLLF